MLPFINLLIVSFDTELIGVDFIVEEKYLM